MLFEGLFTKEDSVPLSFYLLGGKKQLVRINITRTVQSSNSLTVLPKRHVVMLPISQAFLSGGIPV